MPALFVLRPQTIFHSELRAGPCLQGFPAVLRDHRPPGMRQAHLKDVIELLLRITTKAQGLAPMLRSLAKVMFQARLERGCVDCRVYAETGKPQSLLYVEQWSTCEDFDAQVRSERFGSLLAIMESAPQAPELQVRTVSEQRGLGYVRSVRLASRGMTSTETGCAMGTYTPAPQKGQHPRLNP